ncbi:MAG: hypothetical protein ACFE7R_06415 [Candidatus Hodarchaeota archaeon]
MDDWPRSIINNIEFKKLEEREVDVLLQAEVEDVTSEQMTNLHHFLPHIRLPRRHLVRRTWDAALGRALMSKEDGRLCLQYLYVFPFRIGILSHLWNLLIPFIMILWSRVVLELFTTGILALTFTWLPLVVTMITLAPLLIFGLEPHLKDYYSHPSGSRLNIRPVSWLVLYYGLSVALIATWMISNDWINLALATTAILVVIIYSLFYVRGRRYNARHNLEYLPVILWLEREGDKWKLERSCWPYYHKRTINVVKRVLESSPFRFRNRIFYQPKWMQKVESLPFHIDNTWNSFQLGSKGLATRFQSFSFLVIILAAVSLIMFDLLAAFVTCFAAMMFMTIILIMDLQTNLWVSSDMPPLIPLTDEMLVNFWGWSDESKLGVKWKLQHPFFEENLYHRSLDDSMARVVIDSCDSKYPNAIRILVHGHTTPQMGLDMAIRDDDVVFDNDIGKENEDFEEEVIPAGESGKPVTFRLTLSTTLPRLVRLLNLRTNRSVKEGDIYETTSVGSLLGYIRQYIEQPTEGDIELPASGVSFSNVTSRVKSEFRARQRAIMEGDTDEIVFKERWK